MLGELLCFKIFLLFFIANVSEGATEKVSVTVGAYVSNFQIDPAQKKKKRNIKIFGEWENGLAFLGPILVP